MAQDVVIRIRGTDSVSDVFKKIGTAGKQMGGEIEQGTTRAAQSADRLNKSMAGLGAAATIVTGFLANAARESAAQEASTANLAQSIQDAGQSFDDYADKINTATNKAIQLGFDDDSLRNSLSTLTRETRDTGAAINDMALVEDIARGAHVSLEQATLLVTQALNGQVGALRRHGIEIDANASKEEILAQLQARFAGQATAYANTSAGALARWSVEWHNLEQNIGGALGKATPFVAMLPGISVGFTTAGAAVGHLVEAFRAEEVATAASTGQLQLWVVAEEEATAAAVEGEAASVGFAAALGPVGLVLAAAAATDAFLIYSGVLGSTYADAVHKANDASSELVKTINDLAAGGNANALLGEAWRADFVSRASELQDLQGLINSTKQGILQLRDAEKQPGVDNQKQIDVLQKQLDDLNAVAAQYGSTEAAAAEYADTENALAQIINDRGPGEAAVLKQAQALHDQWIAGTITTKGYEDAIIALAAAMGTYDEAALKGVDSARTFSDAIDALVKGPDKPVVDPKLSAAIQGIMSATGTGADAAREQLTVWRAELDNDSLSVGKFTKLVEGQATALDKAAIHARAAADANNAQFGRDTGHFDSDADQKKVDDYNASLQEQTYQASLAASANDTNAYSLGTVAQAAVAAATTGDSLLATWHAQETALDRVARGSSSAAVQLAAFKEVQDGILGQESAFNSQASEYSQQVSAMSDARDILTKRQQDGVALTQQETDFLKNYDEANARATGGVEDATVAQGLLAEQYALNMEKGDQMNRSLDGVNKSTDALTAAVDALILTLGGIPPDVHTKITVDSDAAIQAAHDIQDALNNIDRFINVNIHGSVTGDFSVAGNLPTGTYATGGTVPYADRYASGGITTDGIQNILVGEAGPELVRLPSGSQVTSAPATKSRLARGEFGGTSFVFNNYGDIHGFSDLDEFFASAKRAAASHLAGMGA